MTIHTDSTNRLHVRHGDTEVMVGDLSTSVSQPLVSVRRPFITITNDGGYAAEALSVRLTWAEARAIAAHILDLDSKAMAARAGVQR